MIACNIYLKMHVRLKHVLTLDMTMYDVISKSMGIRGPMLYMFKMRTVKNIKKLGLGFSVINFHIYSFKIFNTNCMFCT